MPQPVALKKLKLNGLWRPTRPCGTPQKDVLFIIGDWNAKVGSQETPGVTGKFGLEIRNEAEQSLIEFCQEKAMVIANTLCQQHKRRLYTCTSPDGQHRNQIDYILSSQRWRSSIQSAKMRPGADWWLRSFRSRDLNQIPYNYRVEVINRFKGLDLIECLKNYGWRFGTLYRRQWSKSTLRKRNAKSKIAVWGGLTNSWENKEMEGKGEKERYICLNEEFQG